MAPTQPASAANTTSVQVAVRIRPPNSHDATSIPTRFQRTIVHGQLPSTVVVDPASVPTSIAAAGTAAAAGNPLAKKQTFNFDQVHAQDSTQHSIYTNTAAPLVTRFLQGFNCTILAYGQTSSGKTYTMTGIDLESDPSDPTNGMGIIPRSVATIFNAIQQLKQERGNAWQSSVKGSFIEIYNEDLIDLLAPEDPSGIRREVQIREEKDGTIIWSGLREVSVKSTGEVMNLIRQGSSIRRTNETDMNAQSSRSHAIFSLTLTQKKYTGTGNPKGGRSSPLPPTPSPSRLARPASVYANAGRVGSPTFGRPPTPSFASAMRSANGRPQSVLAVRSGSPEEDGSDGGAWVTVVSKFHFVDLAGSERLKRTAAQGERIKEGISINSGLLALGNVISALGDPSRSRSLASGANGHIHVPYRDSKLTRLLQDSLGGNSHTLMIACVSPAEWNAAETVNTLKYANRARNIKNRAEVREKEEGWDDLEWLQNMVLKLRKEMKALKDGGATAGNAEEGAGGAGAAKILHKYQELQELYEELRTRYTQATDELRRTKQELEDRPLMSPTTANDKVASIKRYEEIVAPVIEQYEKTISAMEAELKLNRTALTHTNEMYEEQEQELESLKERHATTEAYVEELRARVTKLVERESSTESYVRDLEHKLKSFAESSLTSEEALNELRKEISKHKENESATTTYINELETRLSRTDEDASSLRSMVEKLEALVDTKSSELERLEAKLTAALSSSAREEQNRIAAADLEEWKTSLEERERKVAELEKQMEQWEKIRMEVGVERQRLGGLVEGQEKTQKFLELQLSNSDSRPVTAPGTPAPATGGLPNGTPLRVATSFDSPTLDPASMPLPGSPAESIASDASPDELRDHLTSLRETHGRTLGELSVVTLKYRDALREISDLASQISEIKLNQATDPNSDVDSGAVTPVLGRSRTSLTGSPVSAGAVLGGRRRRTIGQRDGLTPLAVGGGPAKRLFFRHAASTESLHSRSQSQSLSQELSLARVPRDSWTIGESLLSPTLGPKSPMRMSLQLPGEQKRSVESLEKEIMSLQQVLKDRETEIGVLEKSLDAYERSRSPRAGTPSRNTQSDVLDERDEIEEEKANGANGSSDNVASAHSSRAFSPSTYDRYSELKKSLEHSPDPEMLAGLDGAEDSLIRFNELMRSMAQKESQHKEAVDTLNSELDRVRKQHEELSTLSRKQAVNMATELDTLRVELLSSKEERSSVVSKLEEIKAHEEQLVKELALMEKKLQGDLEAIRAEHDAEVDKINEEHAQRLGRMAEEHEDAVQYAIAKARREAEVATTQLAADHESAMAKLTAQHEKELRKHEMEVETLLARTRADHERVITRLRAEHEEALRIRDAENMSVADAKKAADELVAQHQATIHRIEEAHHQELIQAANAAQADMNRIQQEHDEERKILENKHADDLRAQKEAAAATVQKLKDEHETVLTRLRSEHDDALARKVAEAEVILQRVREDHAAEIRGKEIALEGSMSESQVETANAMKQLQDEHAATLERRDVAAREDLDSAKAEHERILASHRETHSSELEKLKTEHAASLAELEDDHSQQVKRLQDELASVRTGQQQSAKALEDELAKVRAEFETSRSHLAAEHEQNIVALKAEHQTAVTDAQNALIAAHESHRAALETSRADHERVIAEEVERHRTAMADMERLHASEREILRKAHDLLSEEVDAQKAQLNQISAEREAERVSHSTDVDDFKTRLSTMEEHLQSVMTERAAHATTIEQLRGELESAQTRHSSAIEEVDSKHSALASELEKHRSSLEVAQNDLHREREEKEAIQAQKEEIQAEKEALQAEKEKQDNLIKELEAQLATAKLAHKRDGSGDSSPSQGTGSVAARFTRPNGIPPAKLPPITPPPSVPPPPLPSADVSVTSHTTHTSGSSQNSRSATPEQSSTPSTSVILSPTTIDPKVATLIEEQAKHLEEQEAMIKTLNKQLTHCEADLQAHMDLVATLEASLTDSERNLRKARMQSGELAKERDAYQQQMAGLRMQIAEAQREAHNMRRSVAEEKQSLEHRLDEERKAKERARAQLDSRMDEIAKRKSKFVCY